MAAGATVKVGFRKGRRSRAAAGSATSPAPDLRPPSVLAPRPGAVPGVAEQLIPSQVGLGRRRRRVGHQLGTAARSPYWDRCVAAALHHGRVGRILLVVSLTVVVVAGALGQPHAYTTVGPRWPGRIAKITYWNGSGYGPRAERRCARRSGGARASCRCSTARVRIRSLAARRGKGFGASGSARTPATARNSMHAFQAAQAAVARR